MIDEVIVDKADSTPDSGSIKTAPYNQ